MRDPAMTRGRVGNDNAFRPPPLPVPKNNPFSRRTNQRRAGPLSRRSMKVPPGLFRILAPRRENEPRRRASPPPQLAIYAYTRARFSLERMKGIFENLRLVPQPQTP